MNICPLCAPQNENVVFQTPNWRLVTVEDAVTPVFYRVIWRAHVREMTDLSAHERADLMSAVWAAERAVRDVYAPDKVNLASLGNQTPHLHWHVVGRFENDAAFPGSPWSACVRESLPKRTHEAQLFAKRFAQLLAHYQEESA